MNESRTTAGHGSRWELMPTTFRIAVRLAGAWSARCVVKVYPVAGSQSESLSTVPCSEHPSSAYPCYTDTTLSPAEIRQNHLPTVVEVHSYPDGSQSGSAWIARQPSPGNADSWYSALDHEDRDAENTRRAARRATVAVHRLVRAFNLTRLVTFTNGDSTGWATREDAVRDVCEWLQLPEVRTLLKDTTAVVIGETGGAHGRVHAHAAMPRGHRWDYRVTIRSWSAFMESKGYHSETGIHRWHAGDDSGEHKGGFASAWVCAAYMSKYLSKDLSADRRKHSKRYRVTGGIKLPEPQRHILRSLVEAQSTVFDTFGAFPVYFRDPEGLVAGFWFDNGKPG